METRGSFITGDYIPIESNDQLDPNGVFEVRGSVSAFMMQVFPSDWIASGIKALYGLKNSDVIVEAAELNDDGSFRLQVRPNKFQMAGIGIAVAITAGVAVSILAGMKVEQVYQVVTGIDANGQPTSPFSGAISFLTIATVIGLGVWAYTQYRKI